MKRLLLSAILIFALTPAFAQSVRAYVVIANINDEKLVLGDRFGNKYIVEAQTYCLGSGWDRGDIVLSTENLDVCVTSTLISRSSGDTCDVWCP